MTFIPIYLKTKNFIKKKKSFSLYDGLTNSVSAHYEVHRILFYARGEVGTNDEACFAFTWSHGDSQESAIFQCHVFRCQIPEAVVQVSSEYIYLIKQLFKYYQLN